MRYSPEQLRDFALRQYWDALSEDAQRLFRQQAQRTLTLAEEMGAFWAVSVSALPPDDTTGLAPGSPPRPMGAVANEIVNHVEAALCGPIADEQLRRFAAAASATATLRTLARFGFGRIQADGPTRYVAVLPELADEIDPAMR